MKLGKKSTYKIKSYSSKAVVRCQVKQAGARLDSSNAMN
jgi:hypothetical protein